MSWDVKFLPPGGAITEATEFAFINGVPFVRASKHEEVMATHVAEVERSRAQWDTLTSDEVVEAAVREVMGAYGSTFIGEFHAQTTADVVGRALTAAREAAQTTTKASCDFDCERRGGPHACMCPSDEEQSP